MRGKAAAQAANRRLAEALERAALLEERLAAQESAHRAEVIELRADLQRAQSATVRQAKQLAADLVSAERDRALTAITEAEKTHLARVVTGLVQLEARSPAPLDLEGDDAWIEVAEAFGVAVGPLLDGLMKAHGEPASRHLVRTSNAAARRKNEFNRALERGELYDPNVNGRSPAYKADRWREA